MAVPFITFFSESQSYNRDDVAGKLRVSQEVATSKNGVLSGARCVTHREVGTI